MTEDEAAKLVASERARLHAQALYGYEQYLSDTRIARTTMFVSAGVMLLSATINIFAIIRSFVLHCQ